MATDSVPPELLKGLLAGGEAPRVHTRRGSYDTALAEFQKYPPPPLRKHPESHQNDGNTGSSA